MKQRFLNAIIGLGIFIAILPAIGIPHSWEEILYVIAGIAVSIIGIFANKNLGDIANILFSQTQDTIEQVREKTHKQFNNNHEHEADWSDGTQDS